MPTTQRDLESITPPILLTLCSIKTQIRVIVYLCRLFLFLSRQAQTLFLIHSSIRRGNDMNLNLIYMLIKNKKIQKLKKIIDAILQLFMPGQIRQCAHPIPKMASNIDESTMRPQESPSSRENDIGDFECNICFELAEDPIVTLCGHLFCWPCLYKWLHIHSRSQECPVCKALIQEDKLVPLYGRGKTQTDPRSKPLPEFEIPHRPTGQRPETAPAPDNNNNNNNNPNFGFGGFGGFVPMASARFGNFAMSAGIGGLFPSLLDMHVHGFQNPLQYGFQNPPTRHGYGHRFTSGFHGGHNVHEIFHTRRGNQEYNLLKTLLLMIGIFVVLVMIL
ncbi:hypothetical protein L1887_31611 [Cichorium endivia]|nr:hypothetical protein L1887_31611 [Cichorium endivia]